MKPCRVCKQKFEPTPRQIRKADWLCLVCRRKADKAWRAKRKESGNPVISTKLSREYHQQYLKEYFQDKTKRTRRNQLAKQYRQDHQLRHKHEARWSTARAINRGDLIKQPCEVCGEPKVDAHHDDYSRPLDVKWLCRKHHNELHAKAEGK